MFRFYRIQQWTHTNQLAAVLTNAAKSKDAKKVRFSLKGKSAPLQVETLNEKGEVVYDKTIDFMQVREKDGEVNFTRTVSAQRALEMAGHAGRQAGAQKKVNEKVIAANAKLSEDRKQSFASFMMTLNPHSNELQMKLMQGDNLVGKNLVTFGIGENTKKAASVQLPKPKKAMKSSKKGQLPHGGDFDPKKHRRPSKGAADSAS